MACMLSAGLSNDRGFGNRAWSRYTDRTTGAEGDVNGAPLGLGVVVRRRFWQEQSWLISYNKGLNLG